MSIVTRTVAAAAVLLLCVSGPAGAVSPLLKEFEDAFISLAENVTPSVVEISAEVTAPERNERNLEDLFNFRGPEAEPDPEGERPPGPRQPQSRLSTGSGFIYDLLGHIITNAHVVAGATTLTVQLADGTKRIATVIGEDANSDLAVIKIDPEGLDLKPVTMADAAALKVGQFAIAMGSPRGLTGSVSFGHVSALGREDLQLPGGLRFQGFIQTDAAINLGNSGGPLCDLDGNVIGVNVAIAYGANSIGFAIPASRVKQVVPQLIATGAVLRGWLGVRIINIDDSAEENEQELQDYLDAYGLKSSQGVWVVKLNPEGPSMAAGLRPDDVILKIDDIVVKNTHDLIDRISDMKPGAEVILNVWRAGEEVDIPVPLAAWKGIPYATYGRDYFGMHVDETTLNSRLAELYGLEEGQLVTVVAVVLPDSPAMKARLRPNDVILKVAQVDVTDKASLIATLKERAHPGKSLLVHVARPKVDGQNGRVTCFPKIPEDFVIELK